MRFAHTGSPVQFARTVRHKKKEKWPIQEDIVTKAGENVMPKRGATSGLSLFLLP